MNIIILFHHKVANSLSLSLYSFEGAWWMVDMQMDILVSKLVIKNRHDCCKDKLSSTTVSLLDEDDKVVRTYRIGDASNLDRIEIKTDESAGLKMTLHNEALSTQQFRITENEQLESISCPGQVLSVAVKRTNWMCKKDEVVIGPGTVDGSIKPANSVCNAKKDCNGDCAIDPTTTNDYCLDGNKLILKNSSPDDESQKWRLYDNGIMNLACKREPLFQGLVISQIYDDEFQDLSLFQDVDVSFVNNGMAISVGAVVSIVLRFVVSWVHVQFQILNLSFV